jgi:hypothetical protein
MKPPFPKPVGMNSYGFSETSNTSANSPTDVFGIGKKGPFDNKSEHDHEFDFNKMLREWKEEKSKPDMWEVLEDLESLMEVVMNMANKVCRLVSKVKNEIQYNKNY